MILLKIIFWICLFFMVYPFALYPNLLKILTALKKKEKPLKMFSRSWPEITLIISAYNEEAVINEKLDNALSLDYPHDKIKIVVVSDCSSDMTDNIVLRKAKTDKRIKLFRQEDRRGKTAGINAAMKEIKSSLVIFSDANAMYKKDAAYELVKYFKDPSVGYVVGAALYNLQADSLANKSESAYWDRELEMKQMESDLYSVVGGDGAVYAIRRELYWPLDEDDINDLANPLQIVAKGYKGIFNPKAVCFEDSAKDFTREFNRKRRIVNRSFRALSKYILWFNRKDHLQFLFMLFSHKVVRWLNMFFIIGLTATSLILTLTASGVVYNLALFGIGISILCALVGKKYSSLANCPKIFYLFYYYYMVSGAAMLGIFDNLRGKRHVTWDHIRK